jgi:hypothetical protein
MNNTAGHLVATAYGKTVAPILTKRVRTYHFQNTPFADLAMVGSRRLEHATLITVP